MEFTTKENNKKVTGYHPPSLGLLHEMGHAYKTKQLGGKESVKELNTEPKKKDWHWRSEQEKWIIENIESPAAKILGLKQRYTYNGTTYKTDGVNSIVPKENPKNKKLKK